LSLSFGNQGSAQAQNLRDSGIPNDQILIANRVDSYAEAAKAKGFHVEHDFATAAGVADGERGFLMVNLQLIQNCLVLFILIPDQVQPRVFNEQLSPKMKSNATIVVASGYNVFFNLLKFQPGQNVVMVAPR